MEKFLKEEKLTAEGDVMELYFKQSVEQDAREFASYVINSFE